MALVVRSCDPKQNNLFFLAIEKNWKPPVPPRVEYDTVPVAPADVIKTAFYSVLEEFYPASLLREEIYKRSFVVASKKKKEALKYTISPEWVDFAEKVTIHGHLKFFKGKRADFRCKDGNLLPQRQDFPCGHGIEIGEFYTHEHFRAKAFEFMQGKQFRFKLDRWEELPHNVIEAFYSEIQWPRQRTDVQGESPSRDFCKRVP